MLKKFMIGALGIVALAGVSSAAQAATFKIDEAHAYAGFKIMHLGYSNLRGRFDKVSGTFDFDPAAPEAGKVEVTIDAQSVDTNHQKRDEHLRSPDFFNTLEFPTITFKSTKIEKTGDNTGKITGDFTLLGVTKPVTLDVTFNKADVHPFDGKKPASEQRFVAGFSATAQIKRSDFGMVYAVPAIADEVGLIIEIEALRQ